MINSIKNFLIFAISIGVLYFIITQKDKLDQSTIFTYNMYNNVDFCTPYSETKVANVHYGDNKSIKQKISVEISGLDHFNYCKVSIVRSAIGKYPSNLPYANSMINCYMDEYSRRYLSRNMNELQESKLEDSIAVLKDVYSKDCKVFVSQKGKMVEYKEKNN